MKKSIIIDFDNTIGYFSQIIYLINIVEKTYNRKMIQNDINVLLNIYNFSFRPKIFEILKFILELKKKGIIHSLILYTKNKNEDFVKMVILFIETHILLNNKNEQSSRLFDHIVFSKTKYKDIETLVKIKDIWDKIETNLCFIDNKQQNYKLEDTQIAIYFIECDTYKYYYTPEQIINKMNYQIYNKLNKKIIHKYFKNIYKNKKIPENIPLKIHEFNSYYFFNLLNNFCFLK